MPYFSHHKKSRDRQRILRHAELGLFSALFILFFYIVPDAAAVTPVITSASTAHGTAGSPFSYQITATNTPTSYNAVSLPAGLAINKSTGLISGNPTASGTSVVTVVASNSSGAAKAALTLTIVPTSYFAQQEVKGTSATTSSLAVSFSHHTLAGDLLVVGFDFDSSTTASSVTDSQSNTFTQVGTPLITPRGTESTVYCANNIKGGSDTVTVNLTGTSAGIKVYMTEYYGMSQTNPVDVQAGATGGVRAVSSGDATTTVAGDVIYGYCVGDGACTGGSGFNVRSTFDNNLIEDTAAGNPGAYAATGSATSGWSMQMVAFMPASASGTPTAPIVNLSATSLAFGSQVVGSSSAAQTVTLTNAGNAALSITSIAISGANASAFAQTNTCGTSVAAGANCTISITFTPAASGSLAASLAITDNATGSPQNVSLSGTGTAPAASLSATSLAFGSVPVDVTSSVESVTLTNTGNATLTITGFAITGTSAGDFAQTNTCGTSVSTGNDCTIAVLFTPSAAGARAATLSIADNVSGSPQTVSLAGTGGHDVILSWTPSPTSGVMGYYVYRGTASGAESSTPLNSTPVAGTSYVDETVTAGTTYYYVVTAVASGEVAQSGDSNEAVATVPSP